jgi:hypothetical protein
MFEETYGEKNMRKKYSLDVGGNGFYKGPLLLHQEWEYGEKSTETFQFLDSQGKLHRPFFNGPAEYELLNGRRPRIGNKAVCEVFSESGERASNEIVKRLCEYWTEKAQFDAIKERRQNESKQQYKVVNKFGHESWCNCNYCEVLKANPNASASDFDWAREQDRSDREHRERLRERGYNSDW